MPRSHRCSSSDGITLIVSQATANSASPSRTASCACLWSGVCATQLWGPSASHSRCCARTSTSTFPRSLAPPRAASRSSRTSSRSGRGDGGRASTPRSMTSCAASCTWSARRCGRRAGCRRFRTLLACRTSLAVSNSLHRHTRPTVAPRRFWRTYSSPRSLRPHPPCRLRHR